MSARRRARSDKINIRHYGPGRLRLPLRFAARRKVAVPVLSWLAAGGRWIRTLGPPVEDGAWTASAELREVPAGQLRFDSNPRFRFTYSPFRTPSFQLRDGPVRQNGNHLSRPGTERSKLPPPSIPGNRPGASRWALPTPPRVGRSPPIGLRDAAGEVVRARDDRRSGFMVLPEECSRDSSPSYSPI